MAPLPDRSDVRVEFTCPFCRQIVLAAPQLEGKRHKCPRCHQEVLAWPAPESPKHSPPVQSPPPLASEPTPVLVPVPQPVAEPFKFDYDDHPNESSPRRRTSRVGWPLSTRMTVAAVLGVLVILGTLVETVRERASVKEVEVGEEVRLGDIGVKVYSVKVTGVSSITPLGDLKLNGSGLVIWLLFKNYNPNRIVEVGSQTGLAVLKDDVGNTYSAVSTSDELGFPTRIEGQITPGKARDVRSDDTYVTDVLVFDRPVPGAKELMLSLDAHLYGGRGRIRVRIPKSVWAPGK